MRIEGDSAFLSHAARIFERVGPDMPADAALRAYLAGPRKLGGLGRRRVSRAVFAAFRWLQWLDPSMPSERRIERAVELQDRFNKDPASVKVATLTTRAVPPWLATEMDLSGEYLKQLQREPSLWIRARVGMRDKVAEALGNCAAAVIPAGWTAPADLTALKYKGESDLFMTPSFREGAFEIQDLASQWVGHACDPQPGETWWDACAGEGGKTLHLSGLMRNRGLVWATDRSERRLSVLKRRAARAGVHNYRAVPWAAAGPSPVRTPCDGVLIDAPCSGVGTWQRNPHARWTVLPTDVQELVGIQLALLEAGAAALKPGGRLVYSVCTLTRSETVFVVDAFAQRHPEFQPRAIGYAGAAESGRPNGLLIWPQQIDANGMFIAAWTKPKPARPGK